MVCGCVVRRGHINGVWFADAECWLLTFSLLTTNASCSVTRWSTCGTALSCRDCPTPDWPGELQHSHPVSPPLHLPHVHQTGQLSLQHSHPVNPPTPPSPHRRVHQTGQLSLQYSHPVTPHTPPHPETHSKLALWVHGRVTRSPPAPHPDPPYVCPQLPDPP